MSMQQSARTLPSPIRARTIHQAPIFLWLTVPLALLIAVMSAIGLSVSNLYHDLPVWAVQVVAQDFVDLLLVLPALVLSAVLAGRGSQRGRLIWLGTLSYLIYTLVIYTFAVQHNSLFLVYVAVLGCSLWAFIGGMATTDWSNIRALYAISTPVKLVSTVLITQAIVFYLLWLADEIPAALAGGKPRSLQDTGLLTNPVHVLDMAILLPAVLLSAVWLWRKQTSGYGLVAIILVNLVFQGLGIAAIMIVSTLSGLPGSLWIAGIFLAVSGGNLALLVRHLRGMKGLIA